LIRKSKPDLVLLDLSMPRMSGFSVLQEIKAEMPEVKILVLSIHESDQYVLQAFEAKADGYAIKDSSREELRMAIRSVLEGKKYISPGIAGSVLEGFIDGRKTLKAKSSLDTVTLREREILKLLAEGYQNKEIADFAVHQRQDRRKTPGQPHEQAGSPQCRRPHRLRLRARTDLDQGIGGWMRLRTAVRAS